MICGGVLGDVGESSDATTRCSLWLLEKLPLLMKLPLPLLWSEYKESCTR